MTSSTLVSNLRPEVRIDGTRLVDDLAWDLDALVVERELNLPARAVLTFRDPLHEHASAATFDIGKHVEVYATSAEPRARAVRIFSGDITGASVRRAAGGTAAFRIVADDPTVRLGRSVTPTAMLQYTAAQVIQELLQKAGLQASVSSTSQKFDYLLQTVTAQYLIDEMCRRAGLVWWFDPVAAQVEVKAYAGLTATGAASVTLEDDIEEYELLATSLHDGSTSARGWDDTTKQSAVGSARAASTSVAVDAPFFDKYLDRSASKAGKAPAGTSVARSDTTTAGLDSLASADLEAQLRRSVVAHVGVDVNPAIGPATLVTISTAPKPVRGKYLVSRVVHEFDGTSFTTRFTTADFGDPLFAGADPASGNAFTVPTLQVAVVTNLNDPAQRGRVKVKYPGLAESLESTWARVAVIGGGADRGVVWLPEIDDEVVVGFEGGDARRPVVLGCLFNGKDKFPGDTTAEGRHDIRRITSKAGNVLEFGDKAGAERILVSAKTGKATVEVAATGITVDGLENPVTIKNSAGASIVLDKQGNITLKGQKIAIEGQTEVTVKANAKLSLTGSGSAEVVTNGSLGLKGTQAEVSGTAMLALKGGLVKVN